MTLQEAKRLAIKKWEWIVGNDGACDWRKLEADIPEISIFYGNCSYCHLFGANNCKSCPLNLNGITCKKTYSEHPFRIYADNKTKQNAQKVLNLIKSIEV